MYSYKYSYNWLRSTMNLQLRAYCRAMRHAAGILTSLQWPCFNRNPKPRPTPQTIRLLCWFLTPKNPKPSSQQLPAKAEARSGTTSNPDPQPNPEVRHRTFFRTSLHKLAPKHSKIPPDLWNQPQIGSRLFMYKDVLVPT